MTKKSNIYPGTTQFPYPATNLRSRNISRPVSFGKIKDELTTSYPSFAMVPTKPTHAPEEFHLFKKLPMELQIEVWRYALDEIGARVISLEPGRCNIPGMIHACQMSRQEASNKFRFCVSRQGGKKLFRFIDFKNDILHLPSEPVEGVLEVCHESSHLIGESLSWMTGDVYPTSRSELQRLLAKRHSTCIESNSGQSCGVHRQTECRYRSVDNNAKALSCSSVLAHHRHSTQDGAGTRRDCSRFRKEESLVDQKDLCKRDWQMVNGF